MDRDIEPERDESSEEPEDHEVTVKPSLPIATTGTRQAFRDIRRQLQESDLASPGVQKLLLEDLERAETQNEVLQGYVERYQKADKRAAVLEERLRSQTALEIMFGVGIGVGSALVGLVPTLWDKPHAIGPVVLIFGIILIVGATIARVVKQT